MRKLSYVFYFVLTIVFLSSCSKGVDLSEKHIGGIVIGKAYNGVPQYFLTIKNDSLFETVQVYGTYMSYEVGDTIK